MEYFIIDECKYYQIGKNKNKNKKNNNKKRRRKRKKTFVIVSFFFSLLLLIIIIVSFNIHFHIYIPTSILNEAHRQENMIVKRSTDRKLNQRRRIKKEN